MPLIEVLPPWACNTSVFQQGDPLDVGACVEYLRQQGWLAKEPTVVVFEGCGEAENEVEMLHALVDEGVPVSCAIFLDRRLSSATLHNIRGLPERILKTCAMHLADTYEPLVRYLDAALKGRRLLVLGFRANRGFNTVEERQWYEAFCAACAGRWKAQPQRLNFHGRRYGLCHAGAAFCHDLGSDTSLQRDDWPVHVTHDPCRRRSNSLVCRSYVIE